ncbi:unnamed protein product [Callosobruchus maculatus]|uniref:Uncharacterized protein n=1 Tax=Callosobruchus maculatus TaxID=64391 RepID=A0A653CE01_CALMS|nr:unnamed protein product [Callosobruchus maculatus]
MPRKSELLAEEAQAVNSPVRRSTRLSQTREGTPVEPAPAATIKSRRWSASDEETAQTKSLRGAKGSQDAVDTKTPTRATRGRRSSITTDTADTEPKPETKKSTRRSSISEESSETKVTPRATRRRSASVDDGLMTENPPLTRTRRQSLEPTEADVEAKRVTRSRRSSVEKQEEPEIVHTPKKTTVIKPKRRGSVTLDPIEEQAESRKSSSPVQDKELSIILETSLKEEVNRSRTNTPEKRRSSKSPVLKEESKLNTLSPRRSTRSASKSPVVTEARRSLLGSKENKAKEKHISDEAEHQSKSPIPNEDNVKSNVSHANEENVDQEEVEEKKIEDTDDKIDKNPQNEQNARTNIPEKMKRRSSKSPVLKEESKLHTLSPRRSTRRSASKSPVVTENVTPKSRRSLLGSKENNESKSKETHTSDEAEHQSKSPIPNEDNAKSNISNENEENIEQKELEEDKIEDTDVQIDKSPQNEQKSQESEKSNAEYDTKDVVLNDTNIQSLEEEKENVLAKSNQENVANNASPIDKIQILKEETQIRSSRVSVGRVSNVFRPKDVDFSFAEPMEVDELSMLNDTRKTNVDLSRVRDSSIDESVDDSFKLTLNETEDDKDGSVLAGSKTEAKECATQKVRLSQGQNKLLNGVNNDDETCQSEEYEFEVPSDDETESDNLKTEKEEDVKDITDQKQAMEDKDVSVSVNNESVDQNQAEKDVGTYKELETSAKLDQSQSEKVDTNPSEREADENDAEADKESEISAQLDQSQSKRVDTNPPEKEADDSDAESETGSQLDQSQTEKVGASQERIVDENDAETSTQLHQSRSEKFEANDVETDNYHDKTTVLDDTDKEVQSELTEMDQTFKMPPEESKTYIKDKEKPSDEVELEKTRVGDDRAENGQTETDKKADIMNGERLEEDDMNGSLNEDSVILVTDTENAGLKNPNSSAAEQDYGDSPIAVSKSKPEAASKDSSLSENESEWNTTSSKSSESNIKEVEVKSSPEKRKTSDRRSGQRTRILGAAAKDSSLSENESEWTTTSSKSSDSNIKEVVDVKSSPEKENTPDRRSGKRTRKLLKTVERNNTRKLNLDDSVVVEQSEYQTSISNKINKYLDSKIADILQSNSSATEDDVFVDGKDESTEEMGNEKSEEQDTNESEEEESEEENEFLDTMAEEGEEDTPSEDSNAIEDEGESVGSSDSEGQETDEYDSDDSFICDAEDEELLPGHEFDLADVDTIKKTKRKTRIIDLDDEDTDVIIMPKKEQSRKSRKASNRSTEDSFSCSKEDIDCETDLQSGGKSKGSKKRSRIIIDIDKEDTDVIIPKKEKRNSRIIPHDSSEEENKFEADDAVVPDEETYDNTEPSVHLRPEASARRSSITILENVNVKDIKDPGMSERIHSLMESFTTHIKEGDIAMNLSLEYSNDSIVEKKAKKRKSDSPKAGAKKSKINVEEHNTAKTSKKSKKKRRIDSSEDLKTKTFSLMNQLITDVKNRPKRSIKPSLNMESSWAVEKVKAKPSVSMIGKKEIEEYQAKKVHPKDLRQKLLYNSGRVNRVDTKTLLKKRAGI